MNTFLFLFLLFPPPGDPPDHLVIISIDGLRPEFYQDETYLMPTLKKWVEKGSHAVAVEGVFPSLTYPSHASIVTGVRPVHHGIWSNNKFGATGGVQAWYWEASDLRVTTLWDVAQKAGDSVAIIYWPSSVGAKVSWRVPERWPVYRGETAPGLLLKLSTPGLLPELALKLGLPKPKEMENKEVIDRFIAGSSAHVLGKYRPGLMLVHLIQVDGTQHQYGRTGEELRGALKRTDQNLLLIERAAKKAGILDRTCFVVVGDHGFLDVSWNVAPNNLLAKAGLIEVRNGRVSSWKALGHAYGGSMGVYARDEVSSQLARKVLEETVGSDGKPFWRVIDRVELDRMGANPNLAFALDASEGYGFVSSTREPFLKKRKRKGGLHGYSPFRPEMA
ncbi:MAG: ectonucleotide pyrophosphatase/phosphodiesterase, partial [Planctomycetota bacterium]|nr:ectonucleotide pyrophosphatase/phosphodiesterase [Planctomycetota bacterium]